MVTNIGFWKKISFMNGYVKKNFKIRSAHDDDWMLLVSNTIQTECAMLNRKQIVKQIIANNNNQNDQHPATSLAIIDIITLNIPLPK